MLTNKSAEGIHGGAITADAWSSSHRPRQTALLVRVCECTATLRGSGLTLPCSWHCADCEEVERPAHAHKPKLIIAGGSSYPRVIDFQRFHALADSVNAFLLADVAHYAGRIVAGAYPTPFLMHT